MTPTPTSISKKIEIHPSELKEAVRKIILEKCPSLSNAEFATEVLHSGYKTDFINIKIQVNYIEPEKKKPIFHLPNPWVKN